MDLLFLAKVLWRKKWILILIPVLAAVAAYVFTMDTIDYYRSYSQIATGFTQNEQVQLTDEKFNPRDADMKFNNLLNQMNTALPVNLVIYRLLLHDLQTDEPFRSPAGFNPSPAEKEKVVAYVKQKLEKMAALSPADPEFNLARKFFNAYNYSYNQLAEATSISRVPNTDYVQIEVLTDNPQVSSLAANAFAEEYIRFHNSMKTERTGQSVEFLKQLMEDKKKALDEKLETQRVFKSSNSLVDVQREGEAKLGQLQELERLRDETRGRIQKLELTIQRLNDDIRNYGSGTTNSGVNNQKIIELRGRIARLNERYVTTGSNNAALLDSLQALRTQLNVQLSSTTTSAAAAPLVPLSDYQSRLKDAEIDLKVERSNLALTESKIGSLRHMFTGYASKEAGLGAIQKEVELASAEYLDAVNKFNEAKNRLISSTTLRIYLAASPAVYPESSKRYLIIGLAAFSSLALCLFAIIGLELIDVSIRTPDKFKRMVGLPFAGPLNKIDSKNFNIRSYFNQTTNNEEIEMYKSLLRKLRHEVENSGGKVVLFTSPRKKDGKTFVMFSLAYVLSLINKRVLIIDTNFKNNSLSQLLVKPQTEIKVIEGRRVNFLIGSGKKRKEEDPMDNEFDGENTYDLINPTKYKNIFIVGNAGGGNDSPAEILSGRDFTNLIGVLVESFDYILLEGAALNDYSDTKELVQYADKVFAVFSADSAIKQLDKESISYLKSLGKKYAGSVLNRVDSKDMKL